MLITGQQLIGLGFKVWGLGFRVFGVFIYVSVLGLCRTASVLLSLHVCRSGYSAPRGSEVKFRVEGLGFKVSALGFRVQGGGFGV